MAHTHDLRTGDKVQWHQSVPGPGLDSVKVLRTGKVVALKRGVVFIRPDADGNVIVMMASGDAHTIPPAARSATRGFVRGGKAALSAERERYRKNL